MPNISLKVTIEKNCHSQNFNFSSLKNSSPGQTLRSSSTGKFHCILKFLLASYNSRGLGAKACVTSLFYSTRF